MSNERNFNAGPAGSLASAQELVLSKIQPTVENSAPLTTRLLAHLADPENPHKRLPSEAKPIDITEGVTLEGLTWCDESPIVSDEERAQLVLLQAKFDALLEQEASFSPAKAVHKFHAMRDEIHGTAKAGGDVREVKVQSKDQIDETFLHRRVALRAALVQLTHEEVVPLAQTIFARLTAHLSESLASIEDQDRACALGFGLKYEPSLVWKATATCIQRYRWESRAPQGPHSVVSPRTVLAGIVNL